MAVRIKLNQLGVVRLNDPTNKGGSNNQSKGWVKLTSQVSSEEVKRRFKAKCAEDGKDMRVVVDGLIKKWLEDKNN